MRLWSGLNWVRTGRLARLCERRTGGADNSLAQPGRKQARATEDFDFHITYL